MLVATNLLVPRQCWTSASHLKHAAYTYFTPLRCEVHAFKLLKLGCSSQGQARLKETEGQADHKETQGQAGHKETEGQGQAGGKETEGQAGRKETEDRQVTRRQRDRQITRTVYT